MGQKTSQLQIRVSPAQKATLKRLAREAGLNVSQYVLATVLPSAQNEVARRARGLTPRAGRAEALADLRNYLSALPDTEISHTLASLPLTDLTPVVQNHAAAVVEEEAVRRSIDPPDWITEVLALEDPHFAWDTRSLRPHLMRITPVAFKRRNVFTDAAGVEGAGPPPRRPQVPPEGFARPLARLGEELRVHGALCELCTAGGAVLSLVFAAEPATRNVTALFADPEVLEAAAVRVAADLGLSARWLPEAVQAVVGHPGGPDRWVELPNLRVFRPPPTYLLAMKCASVRRDDGPRTRDDIRFLLRILNISVPFDAVAVVRKYFSERQLPENLARLLQELLGA